MSMQRSTYTKKDGTVRVYEYWPKSGLYYVSAEDRALETLRRRPLKLMRKRNGQMLTRWTAGQRGPIYNDSTIVKLIQRGLAKCVGEFVELVDDPKRR